MRLCRLLLALAVALVLALAFGTPLGVPSLSMGTALPLASDSGPPLSVASVIPASPAEVALIYLAKFADKYESEVNEPQPVLRA